MLRLLGLAACLAILSTASSGSAQTVQATAPDGTVYLLAPDGTWSRLQKPDAVPPPPPAPPPVRTSGPPPPPAPPRTLESETGAYSLTYDASRWRLVRDGVTSEGALPDSEFELKLPFDAGYAATLYEYPVYDPAVFQEIILTNATAGEQNDVTLSSVEPAELGGLPATRMEFRVVFPNGFDFTFLVSFVSADDVGTLQLTSWVMTSLRERYADDLERLHSGLRFGD